MRLLKYLVKELWRSSNLITVLVPVYCAENLDYAVLDLLYQLQLTWSLCIVHCSFHRGKWVRELVHTHQICFKPLCWVLGIIRFSNCREMFLHVNLLLLQWVYQHLTFIRMLREAFHLLYVHITTLLLASLIPHFHMLCRICQFIKKRDNLLFEENKIK